MTAKLEDRLTAAISLRERGLDDEARRLLLDLHSEHPEDATVNLHCAWIHDKLGLETAAVPFYEKAIASGLAPPDLHDALLGLGSTFRALGRYEEALETLTVGVDRYPEDNGLEVFHAMALYNNGRSKEACEKLLQLILDTTSDPAITRYRAALDEYAADLDRTWA